jgi:hypothetical protein
MGGRGISRRSFLFGLGAAAAAGALLTIEGRLPSLAKPPAAPDLTLRRSLFASHLGTFFQVHTASSSLPLQLIDVRDLHAASYRQPTIDREQNFALLFRSPVTSRLGQDTYHFTHSRIGSFPLFIVPQQHDQQSTAYEAIFGR